MTPTTFDPARFDPATFDPATVLGCSQEEARALLRGKRITPGEVESVAMKHYPWRRHVHDPRSYWVTASQAAEILDLSPQRVKQLLDKDRLPHRTHRSGVRLMRRAQIEAVARVESERRGPRLPNQRRPSGRTEQA